MAAPLTELDLYKYQHIFYLYSENKAPGNADTIFNHPSFNSRYGLELEFCSNVNKYVIANRMNSCMWNQNSEWWGANYNGLERMDTQVAGGAKSLTNNDSYDEWSSFFIEVVEDRHSSTHRGDERCGNRGSAGSKIEYDGSVTINNEKSGLTLWSNSTSVERPGGGGNLHFPHTNLKESVDGGLWNKWTVNWRGLRDVICDANYDTPPDNTSAEFTRKDGYIWHMAEAAATVNQQERKLIMWYKNEYVSPILNNEYILYPLALSYNAANQSVVKAGTLPYGSLLIDNIFNHMKSHTNVIAVQDMGFHLHLSEFPRIYCINERKMMIIGFVKLFYMFEPMFYACHPAYRASSKYCQSLQSVLSYENVRAADETFIWNYFVNNPHVYDQGNRKGPLPAYERRELGSRYLSINLKNCVEGGIGTIEIRLGHSSFSSKFVQAYINALQSLFHFNLSLHSLNRTNGLTYCHHQNTILDLMTTRNVLPSYCYGGNDYYNTRPHAADIYNPLLPPTFAGRPIYGFFVSNPDRAQRTSIIRHLVLFFNILTGAKDSLQILTEYINYYHTSNRTWNSQDSIDRIDFYNLTQLFDVHIFPNVPRPPPDFTTLRNPTPPPAYVNDANLTGALLVGPPAAGYIWPGHYTGGNFISIITAWEAAGRVARAPRYWNNFSPVLSGRWYVIHPDKHGVANPYDHACSTCSSPVDNHNECAGLYNRGDYPEESTNARNRTNETFLYRKQCPEPDGAIIDEYGKTQTELINYKFKRSPAGRRFTGGARIGSSRTGKSHTASSHTNTPGRHSTTRKPSHLVSNKQTNKKNNSSTRSHRKMNRRHTLSTITDKMARDLEVSSYYGLNREAPNIAVLKDASDNISAYYVNWVSEYTPIPRLSIILNTLVINGVVNYEQLQLLARAKYIDYQIFSVQDKIHIEKLRTALNELGINDQIIDKIRHAYATVATTSSSSLHTGFIFQSAQVIKSPSLRNSAKLLNKREWTF